MNLFFKKSYFILGVFIFLFIIVYILLTTLDTRVEYLYSIVRADPLFYSPEIDTHKLRNSVTKLSISEDALKKVIRDKILEKSLENPIGELSVLKNITDTGFLPIQYLSKLPSAIKTTDNFLTSPTIFNAFKMSFAVENTAKQYEENSILLYKNVIKAHDVSRFTPYYMQMLGSKVNTNQLIKDLKLIKENGKVLHIESLLRLNCLIWGRCDEIVRKNKSNLFKNKIIKPSPSIKEFKLLPDTLVDFNKKNMKHFGPYIIKSGCFPSIYTPMYMYKSEKRGLIAKQANENYYMDFISLIKMDPNNKYAKAFLDTGIIYDRQPEGTDYRCTNLEYWGDLTTINYFNQTLRQKNIVSSDSLKKLLNTYKNDPNKTTAVYILENKIIDLPYMINKIALDLDLFTTITRSYRREILPLYLLGVRSAYSLTYNTFSKSIWRLEQKPQYYISQNDPVSSGYKTYTELKTQYSDEEIKDFYTKTKNVLK